MGIFDWITAASTAAKKQLDKLVSPERQQNAYAFLLADRPMLLQSLVITIATFVSIPAILFLGYIMGAFLIHTGIALLSLAFWTASGLAVFVPAIIIATSIAVGVWFWGMVAYLVVRWFYDKFNNTSTDPTPPLKSINGAGVKGSLANSLPISKWSNGPVDAAGQKIPPSSPEGADAKL